ncbi:MAG: adenylyltransferase/cytidyltransferase family protein [Candidatus Andersenbacteria bacterium]|nr:adenylyltransferase/cytidyltransferase family protein [Candidatus Andersenbacteria bacterium]
MTEHLWRYDKILTIEQAKQKADELHAEGKKLVTVNGVFDLLQAGHLDFLEEAKRQGDVLFVGINTDKSVHDKKGPERPIIPQDQRAALLAALACVDYVVIMNGGYDEEPHGSFLPAIKPNVHVNGDDHGQAESWIEYPAMQAVGATAYVVKRRPNLSTSEIIEKIKAL